MKRYLGFFVVVSIALFLALLVVGVVVAQEQPEPKYYASFHANLILADAKDEPAMKAFLDSAAAPLIQGLAVGETLWRPASVQTAERRGDLKRGGAGPEMIARSKPVLNSNWYIAIETPCSLEVLGKIHAALTASLHQSWAKSGTVGLAVRRDLVKLKN